MATLDKNQHIVAKQTNPAAPIVITVTEFKQTVFVSKCVGTVVQVVGKCNSITIEGCKQTNVVFDDIVSTVDIINGNKVNVQANGVLPTINVEKSAGVNVYLTSQASRAAEIVTSLSTEVNVVIPGATENDDPKEHAIPYQFISKLAGGKVTTLPVEHSGN
jgi:adenylyl cyclase-associated protein